MGSSAVPGLAADQPRPLYQDGLGPDSPAAAHPRPTAPPRPATLVLYLVRYPDSELVVAAGAPGPVHVLGSGHRDDPTEVPTVSESDQQFLHRYAMAW